MTVVDTNIIAYLFIEGDRTSSCRKVMSEDPDWSVPFLWRSEFRSVLSLHMRKAGMTLAGAVSRSAEAEKLLAGREYSIDSSTILSLTEKHPVSAYDAEFVCLADKLGTKLVTTDKSILKHFPYLAVSPENFTLKGEQDSGGNA